MTKGTIIHLHERRPTYPAPALPNGMYVPEDTTEPSQTPKPQATPDNILTYIDTPEYIAQRIIFSHNWKNNQSGNYLLLISPQSSVTAEGEDPPEEIMAMIKWLSTYLKKEHHNIYLGMQKVPDFFHGKPTNRMFKALCRTLVEKCGAPAFHMRLNSGDHEEAMAFNSLILEIDADIFHQSIEPRIADNTTDLAIK